MVYNGKGPQRGGVEGQRTESHPPPNLSSIKFHCCLKELVDRHKGLIYADGNVFAFHHRT